MLKQIAQFIKENQRDIVLVIGVVLISLISFAAGYLVAKEQLKGPVYIEQPTEERISP